MRRGILSLSALLLAVSPADAGRMDNPTPGAPQFMHEGMNNPSPSNPTTPCVQGILDYSDSCNTVYYVLGVT